ncbi:phosphotyrosyl phosphate activator (ptpa) protein [Besnoitia besnoiti]|uniref:Serine/threonine-protein phosphatase 2A activator n=1 Tax=Besnoitia besnoiti TaxID=94643 RepID=A0A2A9MDE7_BESBE|nr:phosphotyrosyl phosphate activator (ptpa) protein [Besnoitia besnoiti]PFH33392.1 phosphotyrosyl phosphate activator (ptpa) protein [Besnoitia besnoiti]
MPTDTHSPSPSPSNPSPSSCPSSSSSSSPPPVFYPPPPSAFSAPQARPASIPGGVCCVAPWATSSLFRPPAPSLHAGASRGLAAFSPTPTREDEKPVAAKETFRACAKEVHSLQELSAWIASPSYRNYVAFLKRLSAAVSDKQAVAGASPDSAPSDDAAAQGEETSRRDRETEDEEETRRRIAAEALRIVELGVQENERVGKGLDVSENVLLLLKILLTLKAWIQDIPPVEQPMRFGNRAFRTWLQRLNERCRNLLEPLVPARPRPPPSGPAPVEPIPEEEENASSESSPPAASYPSQPSSPSQGSSLSEASSPGQSTASLSSASPADAKKSDAAASWRETLINELTDCLCRAFGDGRRLDYGTGHEVSFAVFLFILFEAGVLTGLTDDAAVVLLVFSQYIEVCHALQKTYSLEPAGSRGAWGLDDFHFLPFLFGSAQLVHNHFILPAQVTDAGIVKEFAPTNLYFSSILYITETKRGVPFSECAPMLYDISGVSTWRKIHSGLLKMYEGEVLNKFPTAQHFLFGSYFPFPTRTP